MSSFTPGSDRHENDAATALREHLTTRSLGGDHPLVVIVPRHAVKDVLAELDELREYQEQQEELMRRV